MTAPGPPGASEVAIEVPVEEHCERPEALPINEAPNIHPLRGTSRGTDWGHRNGASLIETAGAFYGFDDIRQAQRIGAVVRDEQLALLADQTVLTPRSTHRQRFLNTARAVAGLSLILGLATLIGRRVSTVRRT